MSSVGNKIRNARLAVGYSQQELATRCGWKSVPSRVANYERGVREPNLHDLKLISKVLGVSLGWLVEESDLDATDTEKMKALLATKGEVRNWQEGSAVHGKIPVISWEQAGMWNSIKDHFSENDAIEWRPGSAQTSVYGFYLQMRDDSMNGLSSPSIPQGAIVLFEPQEEFHYGNLVIAIKEDAKEPTFGQLVHQGGDKYLKPLNPRYPIHKLDENWTLLAAAKRFEGVFID